MPALGCQLQVHCSAHLCLSSLQDPILVVLASGESEDAVEEAAEALRKDGVRIVSVGMQGVSEKTLKAMATGQFHYNLRTVRDLSTFSQNMTQILKDAAQYKDWPF